MTREQATGTLFSESQAFPQPNWLVDVVEGGEGGRVGCLSPVRLLELAGHWVGGSPIFLLERIYRIPPKKYVVFSFR
jgi:hypothetical protein